MIDEYNIGKITEISPIEDKKYKIFIDTGGGIEKSIQREYYAKKFSVGDEIVYFWRVEYKRISGIYSLSYFEMIRDQIERPDLKEIEKINKKQKRKSLKSKKGFQKQQEVNNNYKKIVLDVILKKNKMYLS